MNAINLDMKRLRAAVATAAEADTRHYLNGIFIEATAQGARIVSTDGVVLSVQRSHYPNQLNGVEIATVLIPREVIERVKPIRGIEAVCITWETPNAMQLRYGREQHMFAPIDGEFPDYRRVIPAQLAGGEAHFNPSLLDKFTKAAKALGMKPGEDNCAVWVYANGPAGAAQVCLGSTMIDPDYIGIIMPMRSEKVPEPASSRWVSEVL